MDGNDFETSGEAEQDQLRSEPLPLRRPTASHGEQASFRTDGQGFPHYSALSFDSVPAPMYETYDGSPYPQYGGPPARAEIEPPRSYGNGNGNAPTTDYGQLFPSVSGVNGATIPAAARYRQPGYDTGEPTYADTLYATQRAAAAEARRAGVGRHQQESPPPRGPRGWLKPATQKRERPHMPLWQELPLLLVVAFCLAVLIRSFLLQAFFIPSSSMEATLLVGDRVLVNKVIYDLRDPVRGEVVVFKGTDNWAPENFTDSPGGVFSRIGRTLGDLVGVSRPGEKDFIKRVIGLPGDRVSCCDPDGRVYVNGKGIDEPYIDVNSSLEVPPAAHTCGSRRFDEVLVPPGQVFVMGDNRIVSQDSRCQGPVPIENIIGRAFLIVWPSGRWDTLPVPDTLNGVPGPVAYGGSTHQVPATVGAAAVTLPILVTLVGSARRGRRRQWRTRTLRR